MILVPTYGRIKQQTITQEFLGGLSRILGGL